jgi:hypothetical protein
MVRVDVEALISKLETGLVEVRVAVEVLVVNVELGLVVVKGVNLETELATTKMVVLHKPVYKVFMSRQNIVP